MRLIKRHNGIGIAYHLHPNRFWTLLQDDPFRFSHSITFRARLWSNTQIQVEKGKKADE